MGTASNWKKSIIVLLSVVLLAALLPVFSTQAQGNAILALVRGRGATLYAQPGGDALRDLLAGDRLDATGRTQAGEWITGTTGDGQVGWLRAEDVIIYDLLTLPVVEGVAGDGPSPTAGPTVAGATAAPTPTPTATSSPTPLPLPTATPSSTPLAAPGGQTVTGIVRGGGADLLTGPGGQVLASAATGDPLTVVGRSEDGGWLLASNAEGIVGWVGRGRVVAFAVESVPVLALPAAGTAGASQPAGESETVGKTNGTVLAGTVATGGFRLNVRSGPSTTYAIVAKAEDGSALALLARNDDGSWVQVALEAGGFGWVSARFVTTDDPIDALPISDALSKAPPLAAPTTASVEPATPQRNTQSPISNPQSPAFGKLALAAADGSIVLYDFASASSRKLTGGFDPAISPDGSRVAFLRGGQGLLVIDADGSNERLLYSGGEELRAPAWSPEGKYIAFSRVTGQDTCRSLGFGFCLPDNPQLSQFPLVRKDLRSLSRIDLNGENFADIPTLDTATAPSWNAAGIVYQSNSGLQITQDGPDADKDGNPVNRELTREYLHRDPAWRPDGGRIVLMDATANHQEIYALNPDGSGLVALTRPASALLESLPHNVAPAWSPDGQSIAFLSNRDGDWAVYLMAGDGSGQRRLDVGMAVEYRFQNEQVIGWGK